MSDSMALKNILLNFHPKSCMTVFCHWQPINIHFPHLLQMLSIVIIYVCSFFMLILFCKVDLYCWYLLYIAQHLYEWGFFFQFTYLIIKFYVFIIRWTIYLSLVVFSVYAAVLNLLVNLSQKLSVTKITLLLQNLLFKHIFVYVSFSLPDWGNIIFKYLRTLAKRISMRVIPNARYSGLFFWGANTECYKLCQIITIFQWWLQRGQKWICLVSLPYLTWSPLLQYKCFLL